MPKRQEKTVKNIYVEANNRLPEEMKLIVSFEKAEKVVKAPKKPTNKRGLYKFSNFGSR